MHKQFYFVKSFFISLLLSIGVGITVNGQTVEMESLDGSGKELHCIIVIVNNTESNLTSSTVYCSIPAGTVYVPGSTKVNGYYVSDVNGKMPFASGGLINSDMQQPGVLAPNTGVEIDFDVAVGTNYGIISTNTVFKATTSSGTVAIKSNTPTFEVNTLTACQLIPRVLLSGISER